MKRYFIALDGGGSKLIGILFDEQFDIVSIGHGGSVNPNFATQTVIDKSITDCLDKLLDGRSHLVIEKVYVTFVGNVQRLLDLLDTYVSVNQVRRLGEAETGLYAGCHPGEGMLALSGTGSDVFYMQQGKVIDSIGGWGGLICEEGSGYYIGRMALCAAIYDLEKRGTSTALTQLIPEFFGCKTLRECVGKIYESNNGVKQIASLTRCVSQAAASGDGVALSILQTNAHYMFEQTRPLLEHYPLPLTIVVAGGVWKSYQFFESYCQEIATYNPSIQVHLPLVEPVVGNVIAAYYEWKDQLPLPSLKTVLAKYPDFHYKLPDWKSL